MLSNGNTVMTIGNYIITNGYYILSNDINKMATRIYISSVISTINIGNWWLSVIKWTEWYICMMLPGYIF